MGDCHADVQAQIVWKTTQTSNDHVSIGVLPSNHKVGNPAYGRRGRWHPGLWPHRRQNLDLLSGVCLYVSTTCVYHCIANLLLLQCTYSLVPLHDPSSSERGFTTNPISALPGPALEDSVAKYPFIVSARHSIRHTHDHHLGNLTCI